MGKPLAANGKGKLPSRQRHGKLPRSTAKVRFRRPKSNGKPRGRRQGKSCRGTERQLLVRHTARESLSRQRTNDSGQMAKGKLRRARQALSRSSGKETSVTANGKGKPVAACGKLPWSTTNGKFVEAGQRKSSVVGQRQGQASFHGKGNSGQMARASFRHGKWQMATVSLSRQRTKDSGQMAKGNCVGLRQKE